MFWFISRVLFLYECMALEIPLTYDREQREYWPPFEIEHFAKQSSPMVIPFGAQMLQFKFSLEDESIFVYSESCAYVPYCNQNQSLAYFQPSRSRSFTTNDHLFDGSIRGRSGPTGKTGRDSINLNGFNSTTEFGLVDRSTFPVQGDGVFGLGLIADPQRFQRSFLYHLLRAVPFPQIGFTVWPNRNLSIPNSGLMIVGQQLTVGCVNDYQFVFLQYPQKQWIFAIKNVQYDSIFLSTDQQWSTSIQPGRFYTIAPDVFLTSFYSYIRAIQPDSRIDDYYVMNNKDDGPPMPDVTFEIGALQLTLTSRDYLSEMTSKGRLVLFKKRPIDYGGLETDWVFGDNFLQRYCVLLEYTTNPRIGFALSVDGSRSTKINRLYSVFPNLDEDCRLIRGGGFHAQFLTDPIMSWKETDPLKVWANSSIVPVNPKPKDSDDELITRERSTVIQAIQEMRGEDQDRYLATLVQNWPFKWEKRAFEVPGHVAALTCGSTGLYIGVKTAGEAFHPGMNYGLIQIIRRTSKSAVIPPCYISLMTAFALWTVYIKRPIMRDGDVCSSCMLYRGLAISVGSGVFVPMISAPYLSHAVASYQEAANTQPRNLLERLALIVEYNKPIVRHVPKLLAVHLAVSAICVYSTLWGWRHIYQTMDVDPDFVREAVEKEPIETGFVHRIRHKIINTVDYINSL